VLRTQKSSDHTEITVQLLDKIARHSANIINQAQMRHSVPYVSILLPSTKHEIILTLLHFLRVISLNNDFAACSSQRPAAAGITAL